MFSEWLAEQDKLQQQVTTFFQKVNAHLLSSMQTKDGYVKFQFPIDYDVLFDAQQPTTIPMRQPMTTQSMATQPTMALAAHTIHSGKLVEGDNQENPYGKGGLAAKHVAGPLGWDAKQTLNFSKSMKQNIQRIGKEMGLLFEIYVYIHLLEVGLKPIEEKQDDFWAYALSDQYTEKLQEKVSKSSSPLILQFVEFHSKDMAQKMKQKTSQLLQCSVDSVQFSGGAADFGGRRNPSDIIIGCGEKMAGFNLKFTSETKIHMASLAFHSAYELLGGQHAADFQQGTQTAENQEQFVIDQLWELAQQYENQPGQFTDTLNYLVSGRMGGSGKMPVLMAARNYVRNRGDVGWSSGIELDFKVKNNVLYPKPGAMVRVQKHKTNVQLTYSVEGGSRNGTSIHFEPKKGRVVTKVTTLTSSMGSKV